LKSQKYSAVLAPASPDFIRQSPQDRMARPDTADRLGAQRFQHAPYRIPMPRHQRLAEHQPAPRIAPVVYFARGYRRRGGSNESPAHLALQSATAKGWLGWSSTQITIVFPFHPGLVPALGVSEANEAASTA
jgi:hypothetical protein